MLNRAEIIRALIDGLIDSGMDITASAPKPTCAVASRAASALPSAERAHSTYSANSFHPFFSSHRVQPAKRRRLSVAAAGIADASTGPA